MPESQKPDQRTEHGGSAPPCAKRHTDRAGQRQGLHMPSASAARRRCSSAMPSHPTAPGVDDVRGHCLFCQEIYPDTALSLLSDCQTLRVGVSAHIRREYLLQGRLLQMMGKAVYGKDAERVRCVPDLRPLIKQSRGVEELQFYFFSRTAREALRQILSYYPTLNAAYSSSYVEIFSTEASKGKALSALAQHLHLDRSQIACIGDSENDLSMFEAAGTRFAVGNAIDALKQQADHVLPDRDHGPIAAAAAILGI